MKSKDHITSRKKQKEDWIDEGRIEGKNNEIVCSLETYDV